VQNAIKVGSYYIWWCFEKRKVMTQQHLH
jgi:hypothetical protein